MTTKRPPDGRQPATVRQARWRARLQSAGLKRIQVVVPAERVEEIRAIAARMVEDDEKQALRSAK
jgi:hypothetical protein